MIQKNAFDIRFKAPGWAGRLLGLPAKSDTGPKRRFGRLPVKPLDLGTALISVHKDSSQYRASFRKAAFGGRIPGS